MTTAKANTPVQTAKPRYVETRGFGFNAATTSIVRTAPKKQAA